MRIIQTLGLCLSLHSCAPSLLAFTSLRQALTHRTLQQGVSVRGDTRQGDDHIHPSCAGAAGDEPSDHRWFFRVAQTGQYQVHVQAIHDVVVAVYSRDRELLCDDDSRGVAESQFSFEFAANQQYVIVIDGYRGESGPYELSVSRVATPAR